MLSSHKIYLRALEPEDIDLLYKWENDFDLWKHSNTLQPYSREVLKQFVENYNPDIYQTKQIRMMINSINPDQTVGILDLFDFEPYHSRISIGIMIHKNFRQKGFATEAIYLAKKYTFEYLGINQIYCEIAKSNTESLTLFQNCGFEITGIKKQWHFDGKSYEDVYFLQIIKS